MDIFLRNDMILEVNAFSGELSARRQCTCRTLHYIDSVLLENRNKQVSEFVVGLHAEILLVVPLRLFRIETGTGLDDAVEGEDLYKFINAKDLLLCSRIPSEHCKHVHESLREIAVLTIAVGNFTFGIDPSERENRESEPVAVTFAEFALSVRFQEE